MKSPVLPATGPHPVLLPEQKNWLTPRKLLMKFAYEVTSGKRTFYYRAP